MNKNPWPQQQPTYRYQTGPVRPQQRRSDNSCLGALAGFFLGGIAIGVIAFELMIEMWGSDPRMFGDVDKMFYATCIGLTGGILAAAFLGTRRS